MSQTDAFPPALASAVADLLGLGVEQVGDAEGRRASATRSHMARSVCMIFESRPWKNFDTSPGSMPLAAHSP